MICWRVDLTRNCCDFVTSPHILFLVLLLRAFRRKPLQPSYAAAAVEGRKFTGTGEIFAEGGDRSESVSRSAAVFYFRVSRWFS